MQNMSRIIYVCIRHLSSFKHIKAEMQLVAKRITPDNISPVSINIVDREPGIVYGIINQTSLIEEKYNGILLGKTFGYCHRWWELNQPSPDGSFALFRGGDEAIEILSDVAGSRSIWYYHDEEIFIASSSQRAIIMLAKTFKFNNVVVPWILSTGTIGFANSWDKRLKLLPADSILKLNRLSWTLHLKVNPVEFSVLSVPDNHHEKLLKEALEDTFKSLDLEYANWALPLSGGYDSRTILSFLNLMCFTKELRVITWGLKASLSMKGNDAYIARKVAESFKIQHEYYHTDLMEDSVDEVLTRFLVCGEGRSDNISGYTDGFKMWKTIFEDKIQGIIRGDDCFGSRPVHSLKYVRKLIGIPLCSDLGNLKEFEKLGFSSQDLPDELKHKTGETLATYRDRLYHEYRMPTILSALNDLKLPFVEVINPFLSKRIVYQVRKMPDHLRTERELYMRIIRPINSRIPYATNSAIAQRSTILKSFEFAEVLKKELTSHLANSLFSERFLSSILKNIEIGGINLKMSTSIRETFKYLTPRWVKLNVVGRVKESNIDFNTIALRICIATKMFRLLSDDAVFLNRKDGIGPKIS
ncbi:MAG: hypothetical protein JWQ25_1186 [Daejeonella sp.]|nr:hypothetical protein [Daejeonella sp.]